MSFRTCQRNVSLTGLCHDSEKNAQEQCLGNGSLLAAVKAARRLYSLGRAINERFGIGKFTQLLVIEIIKRDSCLSSSCSHQQFKTEDNAMVSHMS